MTDFENLKSDDQMYREMADFLSDLALEHCKDCSRRPQCWSNPEMGAAITVNTVMRESFHYDAIVAYTTIKLIAKINKIINKAEDYIPPAENLGSSPFMEQKRKNLVRILEFMKEKNAIQENIAITREEIFRIGFSEAAGHNYITHLLSKQFIKSRRVDRLAYYWLTKKGIDYQNDLYFKSDIDRGKI